jgi:integrase
MSNGLPHLRKKTAKGKTYYYFDAGKDDRGQRLLTKLPDIKDPRFGDCYARAKAERSRHKSKPGVLTFEGLIRSYEKSPEFRGKAQSTRDSYSRYLEVANKLLRTKHGLSWPLKDVARTDLLAIREKLADTPGAANQTMRALGVLFAWAVDEEKVDEKENPAKKLKRFEAIPHEPWPEDLLEEALADPQVGDAVALFYFTGQRINEVVRMTWNAIEDDYMQVYVQKTKQNLRVALLPELAERLQRIPRGDAVTILMNSNGHSWSRTGLRLKLQAWAKERGHKVVPHGLRKNAVISLLEAGCTPAQVQGITDQTLPVIQHYAKKVNKLTLGRAAVAILDAHRKAKNKGGQ